MNWIVRIVSLQKRLDGQKTPMKIFSRLLRTADERQVARIVEESHKEVDRQLRPLSALGRTILLASQNCCEGIKPWIVASDEKDRSYRELCAFYEFIYFFAHFTMRLALEAMTVGERRILGKHLVRYLESVGTDMYFQHAPDELRRKVIDEFRVNLQKAEYEYGTRASGNILSDPTEADALFMNLGENLGATIGRPNDSELRLSIATLALTQITSSSSLLDLILDFKRDSMELPGDY